MPKPIASTKIKSTSKAIKLGASQYHNIDSATAQLLKEEDLIDPAPLPLPPGIEPEAAQSAADDCNSPSRPMPEPHADEQCKAKEEDHGDACARADVTSPVSYARATLLASIAESSEKAGAQKEDGAMPSIANDQSSKGQGRCKDNFSVLNEPTGVGKAPQQKCIAWRSSEDCSHGVAPCRSSSREVWPTAQAERQKLEQKA